MLSSIALSNFDTAQASSSTHFWHTIPEGVVGFGESTARDRALTAATRYRAVTKEYPSTGLAG